VTWVHAQLVTLEHLRDAMTHATPTIPRCLECGLLPVKARGLCARCYLHYWKAGKPFPLPHAKKHGKFKDPA
jgi:hypothetical protein